ncbi:MAG: hypothetical protein BWZ07_03075 [Alphaproteobacteria bacterium ADurb.BinA280]|nr:MAG: hypothetical protein BWZ07_03075 [Alphaproteobacteria bacterium ADurb.BinA280]
MVSCGESRRMLPFKEMPAPSKSSLASGATTALMRWAAERAARLSANAPPARITADSSVRLRSFIANASQ